MPGTHASQLEVPFPVKTKPESHAQTWEKEVARKAALPAVDLECIGQVSQLELPVDLWYSPAAQPVHDEAADVSAYVPAGHSVQFGVPRGAVSK